MAVLKAIQINLFWQMFKIVFLLSCLWNWGRKGIGRVVAGNESMIPYRVDSCAQGRSQNRNMSDFSQSTNTYSCLVALLPLILGSPLFLGTGEPVPGLPLVGGRSPFRIEASLWKKSYQNRSLTAEAPLSTPDCPLPGDFSTVRWDVVASYGRQCKSHREALIHSDRRGIPRFTWP